MSALGLRVTAPVCSFRKGRAREYLETERVPPPATIYGFLLSLVGEENRWRYIGTRLAIAVLVQPKLSVTLRTTWRVKNAKDVRGSGANKIPDYQEVLTGLEAAVWVADGPFRERLDALGQPQTITRYGGLSLGESRDLVDEVSPYNGCADAQGLWLVRNPEGTYSLPVWVDHVGSKGTRHETFDLRLARLSAPADDADELWITIQPPEGGEPP